MTPELEGVLDKIGWARVKGVAPAHALRLQARLLDTRGDDRRDRNKEDRRDLSRVMRAAAQLHEAIGHLHPESRDLIDLFSGGPDDPIASDKVLRSIEAIASGLAELSAMLDAEAPRRGRRQNRAAFRVADALAEVFVIGLGRPPTFGTDPVSGRPTGDFGRACSDAFALLGCRLAESSTEPIRAAVARIDGDHLRRLLAIRSGTFSRQQPSLFDIARLRDHLGEN